MTFLSIQIRMNLETSYWNKRKEKSRSTHWIDVVDSFVACSQIVQLVNVYTFGPHIYKHTIYFDHRQQYRQTSTAHLSFVGEFL